MEWFRYNVDVIEQCRVYPPPGSVVSPSSLPLTFFDLIWLSHPPVQRLFFFDFQGSRTDFFNTILPNLKHSLSLTLQHFFPLAGNLTWPRSCTKPQILYTATDGVAFTVAVSDQDFSHLDANLFLLLLPQLNISNTKAYPVLALQVTLFPDRGIAIGVTYLHSAADGRSLIHFFKSWASICSGKPPLINVCCDRNLVNDPKGIDMILLNKRFRNQNITQHSFNLTTKDVVPGRDKVAATFVIRPSDVKRLKHWVLDAHHHPPLLYLSTFVLTCAYVWICLIKAQWGEATVDDDDPIEYLIFPMDCRARRKPPLPPTYFGNCLVGAVIMANRNDLISGQQGMALAAKLIGNAIQRNEDGTGILTNMDLLSSKDFLSANGRVLTVAGSPKLGIYDTNFGWGKLKKSQVPSIASSGAMSLCECPDEVGAVEVGFIRNKIEMDAFTSLFARILAALP